MNSAAQETIDAAREGAQTMVERIPPDAWPWIDLLFQIVIGLFVVWVFLSLIACWRRRAYNLTIASKARVNKKAAPDFLSVDKKDRERQIDRGEAHEEALDRRDRDEAAALLAKEPASIGARIASLATLLMSIFTLLTGLSGAAVSVGNLGADIEELTTMGRVQYLVTEHPIGVSVCVFVIGFKIWKYVSDEKWKEG